MPTTNAGSFRQGSAGEAYVRRHINRLLAHGFVSYGQDTAGDHVEGGDNRVVYHRFGDAARIDEYVRESGFDIADEGHRIAERLVGGLEVKTISNFLFRDNDGNEPSGTLPLEIWHDKDRTTYGWLMALLNPEIRLEQDEPRIHAVQPVLLCFLLVSYLGPFACIMVEDFPAFVQRLKELAIRSGFHLESIPAGGDALAFQQDDPYFIKNMWHVPFDQVSDLTTVTMVGDMPLLKRSIDLIPRNEGLQEARYAFLCQCAGDRRIPSEPRSTADFYPADSTHIFADILYNLETIEHLDQEKYPSLFSAMRQFNVRKHLNCVLLNMYAHPYPTAIGNGTMQGFLQARKYLEQWGRLNGFRGSAFSWQSHLVFFTDCGLITKFVDSSDPVNRKTYRSVHRYTDEVLRCADEKAKAYMDAGINLSNFTKAQVIGVSGQEKANILYYGDERVISRMQQTVDAAFIAAANQKLDEQGFVLPDEVIDAVRATVRETYRIDPFEYDAASPDQQKHYVQACRELSKLKRRLAELSKRIPCQLRELKKHEKEPLGLPAKFRKKVFIR